MTCHSKCSCNEISSSFFALGNLPQQTPSSSLYVPDVRGRFDTIHLGINLHVMLSAVFYSPFGSSLTAPVDAGRGGGGMVRKSTSEMYKSQTDWLKTFQHETTYNRPTLNTTPLMTSNKNMSSNLYPFEGRYSLM